MSKKIWLIGSGIMARDYIKVLSGLEENFTVIGRGEESAKLCEESTGYQVVRGGLEVFLQGIDTPCSYAVVAVGVESLFDTTMQLLQFGVKNILLEKPGALYTNQFEQLVTEMEKQNANVYIAYNRRFYASVLEAERIIKLDGGVKAFNFEFTEWSHEIETLQKGDGVKEHWFLSNSTHVVDLAFFLGGFPKEIASFHSGSLDWHTAGSTFTGAGISDKDALFSYQAYWESAGRWSIEILTLKHRLIFRPMEKLQIQKKGSIALEEMDVDYLVDEDYKPGLYLQTKTFIESLDTTRLCTLKEQCHHLEIYKKIANYE